MDLYTALKVGGVGFVEHLRTEGKHEAGSYDNAIRALEMLADGKYAVVDSEPNNSREASDGFNAIFDSLKGFFESDGGYFSREAAQLMSDVAGTEKHYLFNTGETAMPHIADTSVLPRKNSTPVAPSGGFTSLVIPPNLPLGSFSNSTWASSVAPLSLVYTDNTQFVSTQVVDGEQAFRMQLVPSSEGSARNHMQAFLPSTRVGYETEFEVMFENGFDFGRDQKAAKCGFGMGMQSLSQLTNPKRTPGGSDDASDGFSFRLMYNGTPNTPARFAPYYYGADKVPTFGNSGEYLFAPSSAPIETGRRYKVRMQVLPNSDFGTFDGELRVWIDDALLVEDTGRRMLSTGDLDAPWVLQHETFWGGNTIAYAGNTTSYINYFNPRYKRLG